MILTEEQKAVADRLLLTYTEMSIAVRTHIAPETYAGHKRELLAERDAWETKMATMDRDLLERATHWPGRDRPAEGTPAGDGG